LRLECRPASSFRLELEGEGSDRLPRNAGNLLVRAMMRAAGLREPPAASLRVTNGIPLARGLGSSSAAAVAGLAAGFLLAGRQPEEVDRQQVLELATEMEGHPANVAAAILGDLVVSGREGERILALRESWPEGLEVVAVIPEAAVRTKAARKALPPSIPFGDAAANLGRLARLLTSLRTGRFDLLGEALGDRVHQPYRLALVPGLADVLDHVAAQPGALGAYLSGSGPTLAALCTEQGEEIGGAGVRRFEEIGIPARYLVLSVDRDGLRID
jgi:homoserine kinase